MWSSLRSFGNVLADGVREFSEQLDTDTVETRREVSGSLAGANERLNEAVRTVSDEAARTEVLGRLADQMSVSRLASHVEGAIASADGMMQTLEGALNQAESSASGMVEHVRRAAHEASACLLYTSPSPRDGLLSRMPSSA